MKNITASTIWRKGKYVLLLLLVYISCVNFLGINTQKIDYNTQVKPILNKKCIACHGGVEAKAGFSLMTREDALQPTESGAPAIVPFEAEKSSMFTRLNAHDSEERMPYKKEPLSEKEKSIIHDWIEEGANWGTHWAYKSVENPAVPRPKRRFWGLLPPEKIDWVKNDIDFFVFDKLKSNQLTPSVSADKNTLLRRLSLDIIGLPAPAHLRDFYLKNADNPDFDPEKNAEMLVDSLLAQPQFGERWAAMWLDIARYADTKGYERDDKRNIWQYRDWLIKAFNQNMPYDQFLTHQIAGDLLENSTDAQIIATAFHRNTLTNDEGGTDNEEFRVSAVLDRVNTTWEGILGTTFACTQCHGHPYDPFKHEEYYQFMAFFNNSRDADTYEDYPLLRHFEGKDSANLANLTAWLTQYASAQEKKRTLDLVKLWQPVRYGLEFDSFKNAALYDEKWLGLRQNGSATLRGVDLTEKKRLFLRFQSRLDGGALSVFLDKPQGLPFLSLKIPISDPKTRFDLLEIELPVGASGKHDLHFYYTNPVLARSKEPLNAGIQFDWLAFTADFPAANAPKYSEMKRVFDSLMRANAKTTPVFYENPAEMQRETNVFERGNFLVKTQKVAPKMPHIFPQLPENMPQNRLGLAHWLTDKKNPLTARTMVNRLWEQIFGYGLVETLEDMGTQGFSPTHPELLDWLAYRFMHTHNWDVKKILKDIFLSATYRQDSKIPPQYAAQIEAIDPQNRLLSHAPRMRLTAEQIRDQALAVSGALSPKMYGPSVMPFQPYGVWQSPWNGATWQQSGGEDQYRRALYTYWKRGSPYPSMTTFDGTARVLCTARRIRTNTPLQALVTMNDTAFVDAARFLVFKNVGDDAQNIDVKKCISISYEKSIGRPIAAAELHILENLYTKAVEEFRRSEHKTCEMVGENGVKNRPEIAALIVVANAIFNLDAFLVKS